MEPVAVCTRPARLEDGGPISTLLRGLGWFGHLDAEPADVTEARVRDHLALSDGSHSILVAEDGKGVFLGYAAVHWLPYLFLNGPEGYVSELFVTESARGRGVGTQLQTAIRAEAERRGCSRLMLINSRSRESYRRGFYAKQGWEERVGVANFIYGLPDGDKK